MKFFKKSRTIHLSILFLIFLNSFMSCIGFQEKTGEVESIVVSSKSLNIEAEDKSFKLISGVKTKPPFYSYPIHDHACEYTFPPGVAFVPITWPFIWTGQLIYTVDCLINAEFISLPDETIGNKEIKMTDPSISKWALKNGAKKVKVILNEKESYHGMLMILPVFGPVTYSNPDFLDYTIELPNFDPSEVKNGKITIFYQGYFQHSQAEPYLGIYNNYIYYNLRNYRWILWISDKPF